MAALATIVQTDTAMGCTEASFCSPLSLDFFNPGRLTKQAQRDGTAGSTPVTAGVYNNTELLCIWFEIPLTDIGEIQTGSWTIPINVTTSDSELRLTDASVCRVNSSCVSQESLGRNSTMDISCSTTGVKNVTVSVTAPSSFDSTDKIIVAIGCSKTTSFETHTIQITPNQTLTHTLYVGADVTASILFQGTGVLSAVGDTTATHLGVVILSSAATQIAAAQVIGSAQVTLQSGGDVVLLASVNGEHFGQIDLQVTGSQTPTAQVVRNAQLLLDCSSSCAVAGTTSTEHFGLLNLQSTGTQTAAAQAARNAQIGFQATGTQTAAAQGLKPAQVTLQSTCELTAAGSSIYEANLSLQSAGALSAAGSFMHQAEVVVQATSGAGLVAKLLTTSELFAASSGDLTVAAGCDYAANVVISTNTTMNVISGFDRFADSVMSGAASLSAEVLAIRSADISMVSGSALYMSARTGEAVVFSALATLNTTGTRDRITAEVELNGVAGLAPSAILLKYIHDTPESVAYETVVADSYVYYYDNETILYQNHDA